MRKRGKKILAYNLKDILLSFRFMLSPCNLVILGKLILVYLGQESNLRCSIREAFSLVFFYTSLLNLLSLPHLSPFF